MINYCSVHDNQDLFDAVQLKSSESDNIAARARRQALAMSLVELGQGIPFFYAQTLLLGPDPYASADRLEGNRAFAENRRPVWKNR